MNEQHNSEPMGPTNKPSELPQRSEQQEWKERLQTVVYRLRQTQMGKEWTRREHDADIIEKEIIPAINAALAIERENKDGYAIGYATAKAEYSAQLAAEREAYRCEIINMVKDHEHERELHWQFRSLTSQRLHDFDKRINAALAAERANTKAWEDACCDRASELADERNKVKTLSEALEQISERRLLVMDDLGEDASDAMVKVAQSALTKVERGKMNEQQKWTDAQLHELVMDLQVATGNYADIHRSLFEILKLWFNKLAAERAEPK